MKYVIAQAFSDNLVWHQVNMLVVLAYQEK